jgi:predicted GH43/DUF377 family glycosyl hydrolase
LDNPIIRARDLPYRCNTVFNAAAAMVDGETVLLMRVEDMRGHSHMTLARSAHSDDCGQRFRTNAATDSD